MPEATPGEIREFAVPVIVSVSSGRMLCKFGDMHECAEFLLGHPVWTHEFADEKLWAKMKGAIYGQHPTLRDSEPLAAEANKDNWESVVVKITQRFGDTLPLQSVGAKRTEHPMESLHRMVGDKPVLVVEVPDRADLSIIEFYAGLGLGAGRSFEDVLAFTDIQMEIGHQWVQWMFPLPEPSKAHPSSPVMSSDDIAAFVSTPELQVRARRALDRFQLFLANTTAWRRDRDHNHLRITRVIRFLSVIGMAEDAKAFCDWAIQTWENANPGPLPVQTHRYWTEALKAHPEWLN